MALTRVYGRVVYPHGEGTPTPVTGDGVIEYVHATPGIVDGAVHGPDRKRAEYVAGVAEDAWLKPGMWRAYVYPDQGRSYTLHLGVPEGGETTIADAVGEVAPEGIITKGDPGDPGASVVGGRDNGDGTVSFELSDGTYTDPVTVPPGPAGRGIASISDPDTDSLVTITFTDGTVATVQAIRGEKGDTGDKGDTGPASTVPGPAGPPGQVLTPESMLVVGPGRPDAPTTTGMSSAALAALPVGCEYRSTDGASVGAWVWSKRPTGWVVIDGATEWRSVGENGATVYARMTLTHVEAYVAVLSPSSSTQWSIPTEWQQSGPWGGTHANSRTVGVAARGGGPGSPLYFSEPYPAALLCDSRTANTRGLATWPRGSSTWPTTLPGTAS